MIPALHNTSSRAYGNEKPPSRDVLQGGLASVVTPVLNSSVSHILLTLDLDVPVQRQVGQAVSHKAESGLRLLENAWREMAVRKWGY